MMNENILTTVVKTFAKNAGLGVCDTLTGGMGSALKNTIVEVKEYTQQTSDGIYYLQVKTFLETAEIDQNEINKFFEDNPDNQRLGAEIFKILEETYIEDQAKYMSRAFKKLVLGEITKERFNEYVHIIVKLNHHIFSELKKELKNCTSESGQFLELNNCEKNQPLQSIGFVTEEIFTPEFKSPIKNFKISFKYSRTELYRNFYNDAIRECTE